MKHNGLAMLLAASVAIWTVGCGKDEGKGPEGENGGTKAPESAEATVTFAVDALKANEPGKLWTLLPASYQKDVNDVVHSFAAKMPKEAWNRTFTVAGKTLDVLKDKKEMVMAYPLVGLFIPNKDEFAASYDSSIDVLSSVVKSDLGDLEKLRTKDAGELLENLSGRLMKQFAEIAPSLPQDPLADIQKGLSGIKVKTVESDDKTAKLEITSLTKKTSRKPGEPPKVSWVENTEEVDFVNVEGKWLPKEMADSFPKAVADAKKQVEALDPAEIEQVATMVRAQLDTFEPLLAEIAAAEDQAAFDEAVNMAMQVIQESMGGGETEDTPPGLEAPGIDPESTDEPTTEKPDPAEEGDASDEAAE